jgi:hypothetical protein
VAVEVVAEAGELEGSPIFFIRVAIEFVEDILYIYII